MAAEAGESIERLAGELRAMAGEEVNLESGPQVAKILFERLGLKPGGRTPSGALSTRSDVLEELAPLHPFPARLLEYRALTKLKSTYLDALPRAVDSARRPRAHPLRIRPGCSPGGCPRAIPTSRTSRCAPSRGARSATHSSPRPAPHWWGRTTRRSSCA